MDSRREMQSRGCTHTILDPGRRVQASGVGFGCGCEGVHGEPYARTHRAATTRGAHGAIKVEEDEVGLDVSEERRGISTCK